MGLGGPGDTQRHHTPLAAAAVKAAALSTLAKWEWVQIYWRGSIYSLWRAHVDLKPDKRSGESPRICMLWVVLPSVGHLIYPTLLNSLCGPHSY